MRFPRCFLVLVGATLLPACSGGDEALAPRAEAGFRVEGGFPRDEAGRALTLRGMNLAGSHKNAPYFDFHTLPDFERVRDPWGMNAVRFLISWAAVEPAQGWFDETYLDALEQRMAWAREAGLFVVLDMHQDVYGEGFAGGGGNGAPRWSCSSGAYASFVPNASQWFYNYLTPEVSGCYDHFWGSEGLRAHYVEAWRRVARRLSGYDDVILGFDPMNEPYWGSHAIVDFEESTLQPFYEEVVTAVREERPGWLAFLEPASSRNLGVATGLQPMPFDGVVYSPHSYDRDAEAGKGFDAEHRQALVDNAAALREEAMALGAALWIGEYGGMADEPGITDYMTAQYDAFGAAAAGSMYWSYDRGGSYSVLAEDGSERAELVSALVRPWPERVNGDPESWAFDAGTRAFTLRFRAGAGSAPTVVVTPERVWPDGFDVRCDGCATVRKQGSVEISGAPARELIEVRITAR